MSTPVTYNLQLTEVKTRKDLEILTIMFRAS